VRASHHAVGRHALLDTVLAQERGHVGGNREIVAHVNRHRYPRRHREQFAFPGSVEHGGHELGGEL
jgi:hypothetical protein